MAISSVERQFFVMLGERIACLRKARGKRGRVPQWQQQFAAVARLPKSQQQFVARMFVMALAKATTR